MCTVVKTALACSILYIKIILIYKYIYLRVIKYFVAFLFFVVAILRKNVHVVCTAFNDFSFFHLALVCVEFGFFFIFETVQTS